MKRPARLPATPDDIAEWTVYADWLQSEGDPRGEAIAHELAGATTGETRGLAGIDVVTRLGYMRSVIVRRDMYSIHADTLERAGALVASDDAALLEELEIPLEPQLVGEMRRVFAALPVTCRRVAIDLCNRISDDAAGELFEALPGHVREVALSSSGPRLARVGLTGLARWIDDRVDVVELRYTRATWDVALGQLADDREAIADRLAATSRVRARMTMADALQPIARVEIGGPDDAALVDLERRCAMALSTLASHRSADGNIRSRFTVNLYPDVDRVLTTEDCAEIVLNRAGDDWWLERGSGMYGAPVHVEGVELVPGAAIAIEHGARISSSDCSWLLIARDVTPTVRALLA